LGLVVIAAASFGSGSVLGQGLTFVEDNVVLRGIPKYDQRDET
jgi:hypothetical protein